MIFLLVSPRLRRDQNSSLESLCCAMLTVSRTWAKMNIPVCFVVEEEENFLEYPAENRSCADGSMVDSENRCCYLSYHSYLPFSHDPNELRVWLPAESDQASLLDYPELGHREQHPCPDAEAYERLAFCRSLWAQLWVIPVDFPGRAETRGVADRYPRRMLLFRGRIRRSDPIG